MTNDLISREALKNKLNEMFDIMDVALFDDIISTIDNAPSVEPTFELFKEMLCTECDKRQRGEWIEVKDKFDYVTFYHWDCSVCKTQYGKTYNFCPNCGADMRKETENDYKDL